MSAVGVDVGGTFVKAVRLGSGREVVARTRRPTPEAPSEIIDVVEEVAAELGPGLPLGLEPGGPGRPRRRPARVGAASARTSVDFRTPRPNGSACRSWSTTTPTWRLWPSTGWARAGSDHMLMITLGTGIGMGAILGGQIYRGRGHAGRSATSPSTPTGTPVRAGGRAAGRRRCPAPDSGNDARSILGPDARAEDLVRAALEGNEEAREAINDAGEWLAVGLETLVLVFDPDVIVIGGAAAGAGDLLLDPVRRRLSETEGAGHRPLAKVVPSVLGPEAGAVGAAVAALEEAR